MRRAICLLMTVFSLVAWTTPTEAGLFGPSKRELMQRMIDQQREAHHVQVMMYGEMKTQTELLRQIAGQNQQMTNEVGRVSEGIRQLGTATGQGYAPTNPLQLEALPPNAPRNPLQLQALPPNAPVAPTQLQALPPNSPMNPLQQPAIVPPGPILGTSRRDMSFTNQSRQLPVRLVSKSQVWVNPNVRR